ncbi:ArnT family glycosyltransferase [Vacuolonema iberomarrocanum]|uniref:ArnT family glycosyltransferase n=1 Tax=Vacuolonema iberomarrocanum TaxID=3454632 RepID=UPI0019FB1365|nr:glycosyltransferase family 39 protein [filamentous cyanobacterium LEGE 07170]
MKPLEGNLTLPLNRTNPWIDPLSLLGLSLAALFLFSVDLGGVPLRDWDEGTVAQVAREIFRAPEGSLRWLFPTLWEQPYFNKPPLVHNLMAIAFHIGGVNEWTARLPGALLTAFSVPLLYGIGREIFCNRLAALLAASVYLTTLPVVRLGRLAMLDGAVLFFLMVMIWSVLRSRRNARYALVIGLSLGLLCLAKGVMLGLLLGAIALIFIAWDTPRLLHQPYMWLGIFLGTLPVVGWYGAQVLHYGAAFWSHNLVSQSATRIWDSVENNAGPPWYYLGELLKYGLPWLIFLPATLRYTWQTRELGWAKLVLVWATLYFLAISVMATKLPWYILPLYPALALAIGAYLADLWERGWHPGRRQYRPSLYSRGWVITLLGLSLLVFGAAIYVGVLQEPRERDVALICSFLGLSLLSTAGLVARHNPRFIAVLAWGMFLSLVLLMLSPHWVWELAEDFPVSPVARLVRQNTPEKITVYMVAAHRRPSLEFYSDRPILPISPPEIQKFWQQDNQVYLLMPRQDFRKWRSQVSRIQVLDNARGWTLVRKARA